MTVRELSHAQARIMDLLADHPDWTNDELAHAACYSIGYVERLLTGAFAVYRVQTRTGAVVTHLRRRRRPKAEPQAETLGLA